MEFVLEMNIITVRTATPVVSITLSSTLRHIPVWIEGFSDIVLAMGDLVQTISLVGIKASYGRTPHHFTKRRTSLVSFIVCFLQRQQASEI